MKKINVDGIEYEAAPEVINALSKERARADKAEADLATANTEKTGVQAKLDEATEKIKVHDKENTDEKISERIKARLDLVEKARPHLDEEDVKKVADMSDKEIKVAVIKKHYPEAKLDDKEEAYINARFDGAVELETETDDKNKRSDSMSRQRKQTSDSDTKKKNKGASQDDDEPDQDRSRDSMLKRNEDAWKTQSEKKTGTDD